MSKSKIRFTAQLVTIGSRIVLRLPEHASEKLPSRGMVMGRGTINGFHFQTPLEPDGEGSHWFEVDKSIRENAGVDAGDTLTLEIEPVSEWPEPTVPADLKNALADNPEAQTLWNDITTKARWEYIRWIRSAKKSETRERRIETACSKLEDGQRRPCCFDSSSCTVPDISKSGVLIQSMENR
ncbi:YdeI/OmpD-associated family protein [Haladaptatus sp. CMAA 1911]|uniref:YdeI/OmpD-associated family protein n=1 Tax=unclassified Haladaptatus TaxID=2622732 RepID=UPI00375532C7